MNYRRPLILTALVALPVVAHADVYISEVAWMGSSASHADEWIELHNSGNSPVALDGWSLTDGDTLDIALSGTIGADTYAVLERTDDNSAPGSAFLVYTGALTNSGATLTLRRADGGVADVVSGGTDWDAIGGDNDTKATAQRKGSVSSGNWITAEATPGAPNSTTPVATDEGDANSDDSNTETAEKKRSGNSVSDVSDASADDDDGRRISLELPDHELTLSITAPSVGYVGQPVQFSAAAAGIGGSLIESLNYRWNFGDTYTASTREPHHTYAYPGDYTVVLDAAYARHEATARHTISIVPMELSLERSPSGTLVLTNESEYEMDLGGFTLRGDRVLTMPEHTLIASGATLRVAPERIESGVQKMVALYNSGDTLVAADMPNVASRNTPPERHRNGTPVATAASKTSRTLTESVPDLGSAAPAPEVNSTSSAPAGGLQAAVSESGIGLVREDRLPYLFLAVVILLGLIGIYAHRWNE